MHKLNWPRGPRQVNKTLSYNLCAGGCVWVGGPGSYPSPCFYPTAVFYRMLENPRRNMRENCMSHNTHLLLLFLLLTIPCSSLLYFFGWNFKEEKTPCQPAGRFSPVSFLPSGACLLTCSHTLFSLAGWPTCIIITNDWLSRT